MRSVRFVTAHRGDRASFETTPIYTSLAGRYSLYAATDNTEGLSVVYNRFLNGEYSTFQAFGPEQGEHGRDDIVVFLHDDVEMLGGNVEVQLNRWCDRGFSIMGLAGASRLTVRKPA